MVWPAACSRIRYHGEVLRYYFVLGTYTSLRDRRAVGRHHATRYLGGCGATLSRAQCPLDECVGPAQAIELVGRRVWVFRRRSQAVKATLGVLA